MGRILSSTRGPLKDDILEVMCIKHTQRFGTIEDYFRFVQSRYCAEECTNKLHSLEELGQKGTWSR